MPTSKRKALGGGYTVPAAVDTLRDGSMHSHLFLFHNVWTGDIRGDRAALAACHDEAHRYAARNNGRGMQPHTHSAPVKRQEYHWDG